MQDPKAYIAIHKERMLDELLELLKIASVSADPAYKEEVHRAAAYTKEQLERVGCTSCEVIQPPGYPVVYGEKIIDPNLSTVLVYGHYDVQPPDPINLWDSPPFEPVVRSTETHPEGAIFARGACDDKGQFYMHVKAVEYMTQTDQLPCNVKFMIEGEEEVGSDNLAGFLKDHLDKLACDIILISDTGMISRDIPSIQTGLRGLSYVEVEVTGPNRDLHSGVYGGAVANPINVLSQMIASLHDEKGHITIPQFYDKVVELSAEEREAMARVPFDEKEYKEHLNISAVRGEAGYTTNERASTRPTLDVNGIWGGYIGEGVGASFLFGETLADLLIGKTSELTEMPWVQRRVLAELRRWEPEPFPQLGLNATMLAFGAEEWLLKRYGDSLPARAMGWLCDLLDPH